MVKLTLLGFGLLLPWCHGAALLLALRRTPTFSAGELPALLAHGFFLGYALTAALLWLGAQALGYFPVPAIAGLQLLTLGLLLWRAVPPRFNAAAMQAPATSAGSRLLGGLLLAGIAAHLLAGAIEVLYRPLFPWDGWLNWMYRARIWFYNDALLPFAEPAAAVAGESTASYNVDGAQYPPLLPLLALWSARCFGAWTDTLINLPSVLAAGALALGFYGQCRALQMRRRVALFGSYALLSMPLVGAHFALAGQADIWLACYSGLGIIAVLRGLLQDDRRQWLLGLLLCLIGAAVKLEGWLWVLLAVSLLPARRLAWSWLAAWALFLALLLFAWLAPQALWQSTVVSGIGSLLPVMAGSGSAPELADDYLQNYLLGGSWHLAGWLSLAALPLLLRQALGGRPSARLALAFLALQGSLLLLVFNYSTNSAWAEDWTAINRLPLQLIAVHCFIWLLLADRLHREAGAPLSARRAGAIVAGTLLLGLAVATAVLPRDRADGGGERAFPADTLRAVVGSGALDDGVLVLSGYRNNLAVASSGPVSLDLRHYPLVAVSTGGDNRRSASFFWRSASDPQQLSSRPLPVRGSSILDLRGVAGDTGVISEFGVLAYGDNDRNPLRIEVLRFLQPTAATLLRKLWLDWTQPVFWTQKSTNWIPAGNADPLFPLPLAAALLMLLLAAVSLLLLRRQPARIWHTLLPGVLIFWLLLDLRWLGTRLQQAQRTLQTYPPITATTHDFSNDSVMSQSMAWALADSADLATPLLISAERADMRYEMLRAKYQAAPRPALVLETLDPRPLRPGTELLLLRSPYGGGAAAKRDLRDFQALLEGTGLRLRMLRNSPTAALARVEERDP